MRELDRRTTIRALGAAASLAGVGGLAAASDGTDEGNAGLEEWFEETDGFEETVDETDTDEVDVAVGVGDDGMEFDPMSVRITEGTTVVWEWANEDEQHDVTHDPASESEIFEDGGGDEDGTDPEFESELVEDPGHTFEHEFEEGGRTYLYVCTAHEIEGMHGAVIVDAESDE